MDAYNLYPVLLLAGFFGSVVFIAAQDGPPKTPWAVISPIVAGTLTANYLPFFVISYFFGEKAGAGTGAGAAAFIVGLGGPFVARQVATRWLAWKPGGSENGSMK